MSHKSIYISLGFLCVNIDLINFLPSSTQILLKHYGSSRMFYFTKTQYQLECSLKALLQRQGYIQKCHIVSGRLSARVELATGNRVIVVYLGSS